ncbi:MAG: pilus assembly protein, partial [Micrococcales bacterium]|nr:pilus assembly protein [Micrococcales bacterium]
MKRLRNDSRDGGQAVVELIAYLTAVTMVAVACVQGIYVVQGVSAAQQAARDGARASSKGQSSCESVMRDQLPDWARLQSSSCSGGQASVTVQIPIKFGTRTMT